ncbi:DUF4190 domain-containing protein [Candidatus Saccharibacteria bacterium]|nr:DUF4190 domain-containing protein [Candidatus Saccharibacteria bacterium]
MPPQDNQNPQPVPPEYPASQGRQFRPEEGNTIAVVGFVLAFLVPLAGLICSIIGLSQSKRMGGRFHGLALAGVILSIVFTILSLLWVTVIVIIVVPAIQRNARNIQRQADVTSLQAEVNVWVANNEGGLPATQQDLDDVVGSIAWDYYAWGHYGGGSSRPDAMVRDTAVTTDVIAQNGTVIMFEAATTDRAQGETLLPGVDAIHIWLGRECSSEFPRTLVEDYGVNETVYTGSLRLFEAQSIAYVYQLEGEDEVRCENNI